MTDKPVKVYDLHIVGDRWVLDGQPITTLRLQENVQYHINLHAPEHFLPSKGVWATTNFEDVDLVVTSTGNTFLDLNDHDNFTNDELLLDQHNPFVGVSVGGETLLQSEDWSFDWIAPNLYRIGFAEVTPDGAEIRVKPELVPYASNQGTWNGSDPLILDIPGNVDSRTLYLQTTDYDIPPLRCLVFPHQSYFPRDMVNNYLPEIVRVEYPEFRQFLISYFDFLGSELEAGEFIVNLTKYADIDETVDEFLDLFHREFGYGITKNTKVDRRLLLKKILDFYLERGNERSFKFLMWILHQEHITLYYPKDNMLIASDEIQGRLSDLRYNLSDNRLYQLFSYVVRTTKNKREWDAQLRKMVHPSSFALFGDRLIEKDDLIVNETGYEFTSALYEDALDNNIYLVFAGSQPWETRVDIASITNDRYPLVTTVEEHPFVSGDWLTMEMDDGMMELHDEQVRVYRVDETSFYIMNFDTRDFSQYVSGGVAVRNEEETPPETIDQDKALIQDDILGYMGLIAPRFAAIYPRTEWILGAFYQQFDAVVVEDRVYEKVNDGIGLAQQTPTHTEGEQVYGNIVWAYRFTLTDFEKEVFLTDEYMPIIQAYEEFENSAEIGTILITTIPDNVLPEFRMIGILRNNGEAFQGLHIGERDITNDNLELIFPVKVCPKESFQLYTLKLRLFVFTQEIPRLLLSGYAGSEDGDHYFKYTDVEGLKKLSVEVDEIPTTAQAVVSWVRIDGSGA